MSMVHVLMLNASAISCVRFIVILEQGTMKHDGMTHWGLMSVNFCSLLKIGIFKLLKIGANKFFIASATGSFVSLCSHVPLARSC